MKRHSNQTIAHLKLMRRRGYSIEELVKELSLPKTTIWHHVHEIKLSNTQLKRLKSNQGGSRLKKEKEIERATKDALQLLAGPKRFFAGLLSMLYWAEGHQAKEFTLTNTSPEMIKLFIELLNKCFGIKREQLSVTIRYFTGMNQNSCLSHWSKVTRVPKSKIKMYYNDGQKRGRSLFGMCRLNIKKGSYYHKVVRALIQYIAQDLTPSSFNG